MKDVLGGVFLVLHVPDQSHSVGLVWSVLVVVIGGHQQLGILWGEDGSVLITYRSHHLPPVLLSNFTNLR